MANLGVNVGTDVKLGADSLTFNTETAYRQVIGESYATLTDGRTVVTTAGTRVQLASSASIDTTSRKVIVTAELDNTGVIVVGGSTVVASLATRRGIPLDAGDSITIPVTDLEKVYLDSTVSGDGVTFLCLA